MKHNKKETIVKEIKDTEKGVANVSEIVEKVENNRYTTSIREECVMLTTLKYLNVL